MRWRAVLAMLFGFPVVASAQLHLENYRIGTKALHDGLQQFGYIEGQNFILGQRYAAGRQERLGELATDLVRSGVDVIVTGGNPVVAAVSRATGSIPIVMAASRDPVVSGFVASLSRQEET